MTETRNLTAEEWAEFAGVFEKAVVYSPDSVRRFVDTRLNKIYDVFLLDDKLVLKKSDRDKEKFEQFLPVTASRSRLLSQAFGMATTAG